MDKVFSNNLKKFRQQKNFTQEQVAEKKFPLELAEKCREKSGGAV